MESLVRLFSKCKFQSHAEKPLFEIEKIEAFVKFKLPFDYLFYLKNYEEFEGFIGQEYVRLWPIEQLIEINKEYEITDNLQQVIGIGSNGGGELIAIEFLKNERYKIVLCPLIDLDKNIFIEIGNSFTDFIERMDNGQPWFK